MTRTLLTQRLLEAKQELQGDRAQLKVLSAITRIGDKILRAGDMWRYAYQQELEAARADYNNIKSREVPYRPSTKNFARSQSARLKHAKSIYLILNSLDK